MKFLIEARDPGGRLQRGAVDAASAAAAIEFLQQKGYTAVRLISSETTAALRNDLDKLSPAQVQEHARKEIFFHTSPTVGRDILFSLWEVTRGNAGLLLAGLVCLGWGLHRDSPWRIAAGLGLLLAPYALLFWNRRHVDNYRKLQRCMALGRWQAARKYLARMRRKESPNELLAKDLDKREVLLDIREGMPLERALQKFAPWRERLRDKAGAWEGDLVGIYLGARDYPRYLATAHAWRRAQPAAEERKVEVALAEMRFGDPAVARELLDSLDARQLTPVALRFKTWATGLLALTEGHTAAALDPLQDTVAHYRVFSRKTPVGLSMLALSSAALAVAFARSGRRHEGQALLRDPEVDAALRVSIYPQLQQWLVTELGWQASIAA